MSKLRFHVLILVVAVVALTTGCRNPNSSQGGSSSSGNSAGKQLTLAVIPKETGGDFWLTVEEGARAAAKDLDVTIKWEGPLTELELAEQNKIIENMLNLGVDGMALAPLNNRAMATSVANVKAAGIPVVIFDSAVDGNDFVS